MTVPNGPGPNRRQFLQDSFVATAYFRHGKDGPLDKHDWKIFFASLIISNLWWTLRWGVIITVVVGAWRSIFG